MFVSCSIFDNFKIKNLVMPDILTFLLIGILLGVPVVYIAGSYSDYGFSYGNTVLFVFLGTLILGWGVDSYINDVMKLTSPCGGLHNPVLFKLLFYCSSVAHPSVINSLPMDFMGNYYDWGFIFERLLLDYISYWTSVFVLLIGMVKGLFGESWSRAQWEKYGFWNFIICQFILQNEFIFGY